jgi:sortase (surface protein transpeptidase)
MDRRQQRVFDPMFVPRAGGKSASAYKRRSSSYYSARRVMESRPSLVAKPAPVRARAARPLKPASKLAIKKRRVHKRFRMHWHLPRKQTAVLYAMAAVVFIVGLVVSLGGAKTNHQVEAQVKHGQQQTEATVSDSVVPSTTKPSDAQIKSYAVSPMLARYLDIPKLSVHTRVLSEGLTRSGQLQVPWNIYDVGWYNASSQPGEQGAMLVDGHSGIGKTHGIFYRLATLTAGDPIVVTRGDGKQFTYVVTTVKTMQVGDVDMAGMLVSADTNKPGLNLITCTGDIIRGTTELNQRILVYAVLQ